MEMTLRQIGQVTLFAACATAFAQAPFTAPAEVDYRKADIWSEGTRMSAEVFSPKAQAGKKLPTILMAHGWGGTKIGLRPDAVLHAKNPVISWSRSTIAAGAIAMPASPRSRGRHRRCAKLSTRCTSAQTG